MYAAAVLSPNNNNNSTKFISSSLNVIILCFLQFFFWVKSDDRIAIDFSVLGFRFFFLVFCFCPLFVLHFYNLRLRRSPILCVFDLAPPPFDKLFFFFLFKQKNSFLNNLSLFSACTRFPNVFSSYSNTYNNNNNTYNDDA